MINKFTDKKILIAVTLIFLSNCSANTYSNFDNNNSRSNDDFWKKNNYVSCGSSSYYLYNNYSYQDSKYNFRCQNPWQNQKKYGYYDTNSKKWINTYAKK